MRYCGKCGKEIADDVKFCPNCGNDTQQGAVIQQTIIQQPHQAPQSNGVAVAAFVCAFFVAPLGLILGVIGIIKGIKVETGLGLSVAAVIISLMTITGLIMAICAISNLIDNLFDGLLLLY